jgi:predicted transcriptional regulator
MVSPMVGARIPPDLHHQLLEAAARLQVTPSEVIVAALRQYLERLQTPVNVNGAKDGLQIAEILDRLERLEQRVEALEVAKPRRVSVAEQQRSVAPPSDLEALPVLELRRLARRVIGPGGDKNPSTGQHLRRAELLAALRRVLGRDRHSE